jgi:CHAD domain-containing protein
MKRKPSPRPFLPADRLHRFLAGELISAFKAFRRRWRKCRSKPSEKAVHELRVECRRLLAELELLSALGLVTPVEGIRLATRKLLSALAKLRDAQVQRAYLKDRDLKLPDCAWLERGLRRAVLHQRRRVVDKLEDFAAPRRLREVRELARTVRLSRKEPQLVERDATLTMRTLDNSFRRVSALAAIADPKSPATLHAVRIAFKTFRYQVEFLAPLLGYVSDTHLRRLRSFQTVFGEFNDADAMAERIAQLRADHPKRKGLVALEKAVRKRGRPLLRRAVAAMGRLETLWPPPAA